MAEIPDGDLGSIILATRSLTAASSIVQRGTELVERLSRTEKLVDRDGLQRAELSRRGLVCAMELLVTDKLTKLGNGPYMHLTLRREAKRALSDGHSLSFIVFELNNFENLKETHGLLFADRLEIEVAAIIRSNARTTDYVTRCAQNTFAIVLPQTDRAVTSSLAERTSRAIAVHQFLSEEGGFHVTALFGAATLPEDAVSADDLIKVATRHMS